MQNKKALVAMSGGVDSSVAAYLAKERGFDCIGATMKLFNDAQADTSGVKDACGAAGRLGIPHYVFDLSGEFKRLVMDSFVAAYERGDTPNPCVDCNRFIKFKLLLQRSRDLSCQYLVTGHYARIGRDSGSGRLLLKKAVDQKKDQSYFLYSLTQEELSHVLFPLGELTKEETRTIAAAHGFSNAQKTDSQDICFVPGKDYAGFIERYTGRQYPAGDFLDIAGQPIGRHKGIIRYTIGQRRHLGLSSNQPLYVLSKDAAANTVTVAPQSGLYTKTLTAGAINWIAWERLDRPKPFSVKTRYCQKEAAAIVEPLGANTARVVFSQPHKAAARGQAVVFYDGDIVAGGGRII